MLLKLLLPLPIFDLPAGVFLFRDEHLLAQSLLVCFPLGLERRDACTMPSELGPQSPVLIRYGLLHLLACHRRTLAALHQLFLLRQIFVDLREPLHSSRAAKHGRS